MARVVAQKMQTALGNQPIVIENRTGAAAAIGAGLVAKSTADGYTLLFGTAGSQLVLPVTTPGLPYSEKDFTPIGHVSTPGFVMVVRADSPYRTLNDVIDAAKLRPNALSYMSTGVRGAIHVFCEALFKTAGVSLIHVPYAGSSAALADLLSGRVDLNNITVAVAMPFIKEGKIRPILNIGAERSALLPGVPTPAESGFPGVAMVSWNGIFAPSGTPAEVVQQLNRALNLALADFEVKKRVAEEGSNSLAGPPEQFREFVNRENKRWVSMARVAGDLN